MTDDEQAPEPGHFLPGGVGDRPEPAASDVASDARSDAQSNSQLGLGKARPLGPAAPRPKTAAPLPADPEYQGFYSGPPPAPLPNAPIGPLSESRRLNGPRRVGWSATPARPGAQQFGAQPRRVHAALRLSQPIVILLCALVLVVVSGGSVAAYKVIGSPDSTAANPLSQPPVKPLEKPSPLPPPVTVTKEVPAVPDKERMEQNSLYKIGKLPTVNCPVPKVKLDTKANALRFYQVMMKCLTDTWEPLVVTKAEYPFRQPKLVLADKSLKSPCTGESATQSFYCGANETITMQWTEDLKNYKKSPLNALNTMSTVAHEYGHHIQQLTNISISVVSQELQTKSAATKLELSRRQELQASCLGAAFLGANKATLQITGDRLKAYEYLEQHAGDEYNPKKVRDHGSRKNNWLWTGTAFKSTDPASCNTFAAPAAKVS